MKPYYQDPLVTIYHGDARQILPRLPDCDTILTDPVWPNALPALKGSEDPWGLLEETAALFAGRCRRAIVVLGVLSDPRILQALPAQQLPFLRACWLPYQVPPIHSRAVISGNVAYVFGQPPQSLLGRRVMPGEGPSASPRKLKAHPCPMRYEHCLWLVSRFTDGLVIDPFMGSGTTLLAAKNSGRQAIGIELEERFCEEAVHTLKQEVLAFAPPLAKPSLQPVNEPLAFV